MSPVRLLDVRATALSLDEAYAAVASPGAGGIALFVGAVRDLDEARAVTRLSYSAHPSANGELRRVADAVAAEYPGCAIAALHRVGDLAVGDVAVVVAAAAAHRGEAFAACRRLIDDIKATVPIWKHQRFADGTQHWVGTP